MQRPFDFERCRSLAIIYHRAARQILLRIGKNFDASILARPSVNDTARFDRQFRHFGGVERPNSRALFDAMVPEVKAAVRGILSQYTGEEESTVSELERGGDIAASHVRTFAAGHSRPTSETHAGNIGVTKTKREVLKRVQDYEIAEMQRLNPQKEVLEKNSEQFREQFIKSQVFQLIMRRIKAKIVYRVTLN